MKFKTIIIILFFINNFICAQHAKEYLADVYDQSWIIESKIKAIEMKSYSTKSDEKLGSVGGKYKYKDGIKVESFFDIKELSDSVFQVCSDTIQEEAHSLYYLNKNKKIIQESKKYFITKFYAYDENNFIKYLVTENALLKTNERLRGNSMVQNNSKTEYIRDSNNRLVQKIEYKLEDTISINSKNSDDIFNSGYTQVIAIWRYFYENDKLIELTVDRYKKTGELKRFRTVKMKHENNWPSAITWYAGEPTEKNIRFTRRFTYEFEEE